MSITIQPASKLSRRRAVQEQAIADFSLAAAQFLDIIFNNAEIANLLSSRGYGTAKLTKGCNLQQRLQAAIEQRQLLIGAGAYHKIVGGEEAKATADRNAAYEDLKTYMQQLKGVTTVALCHRPDLLKKLEG